jgi:Fe-S cluster assembly protein SufD
LTETLIKNAVDAEIIKTISASEPAWLRELRLGALERYAGLPQPTERSEGWRRLSLKETDLSPAAPSPAEFAVRVSDADRAKGIVILPVVDALGLHEPLLREVFLRARGARSLGRFSALAEAAWQGGVLVRVPDGVTASDPIHLDLAAGAYPRVIIAVGKNARAAVTETHRESGRLTSGVVDILLEDGAHLTYAHVQECGRDTIVFSHQHARIGRDAKLVTLNFGLGGRLAKSDVEVELLGRGAHSDMLGLIFAEGSQQFDYHTLQGHRSPDTRSDLLFKAALDDESHSVYTGVIIIDKGAQRSDAYQANRNLLLGANARADTEPKLEIEADDVRCTHGATVGPIDEEQLFYLQSRGLDVDSASRLVVDGFFQDVLDRVGDPRVTDPLREKVWPHLGRLGAH